MPASARSKWRSAAWAFQRAHDRILKVARTVAGLGESQTVSAKHVAEAVQYRSLDRNYWSQGAFREMGNLVLPPFTITRRIKSPDQRMAAGCILNPVRESETSG